MDCPELQELYAKLSSSKLYPKADKVTGRCFSNHEIWRSEVTGDAYYLKIRQFVMPSGEEAEMYRHWADNKNNYCRLTKVSEKESVDIELAISGEQIVEIVKVRRLRLGDDVEICEPEEITVQAQALEIVLDVLRSVTSEQLIYYTEAQGESRACGESYFYKLEAPGNEKGRSRIKGRNAEARAAGFLIE